MGHRFSGAEFSWDRRAIQNLEFRIWEFGIRVTSSKFQIPNSEFQILNLLQIYAARCGRSMLVGQYVGHGFSRACRAPISRKLGTAEAVPYERVAPYEPSRGPLSEPYSSVL